jgi:hypothetical protein
VTATRLVPRFGKQSQTRASWGVWGTGRRREEHRANAPNKPNSSIADCGFGMADSERPGARRDTTAPNKANFQRRKKKGKCLVGKELW